MTTKKPITVLEKEGILLLSDPALPSVVKLIGGPDVRGSWWGHKRGHEIFRQLNLLESHPDALVTRLISGKVTYIHRKFWTEFLSIASARDDWQIEGLTRNARELLRKVDKRGEVTTKGSIEGDAARELERRLLAYGEEIHTERGSHAKVLMSWSRCPKVRDLRVRLVEPNVGRSLFERILDDLNRTYGGKGKLPWRQN